MIVNKPQFDENELGEGMAIQVSISSKDKNEQKTNWNAIVVGFTPLAITVVGYNPKPLMDIETVEIRINQVTKGKVSIEKLVRPLRCENHEEVSANV